MPVYPLRTTMLLVVPPSPNTSVAGAPASADACSTSEPLMPKKMPLVLGRLPGPKLLLRRLRVLPPPPMPPRVLGRDTASSEEEEEETRKPPSPVRPRWIRGGACMDDADADADAALLSWSRSVAGCAYGIHSRPDRMCASARLSWKRSCSARVCETW